MAFPVEARSLSALTNLAANPPRYPRNPTQNVQEPLVLYIARVPGSRDVFLTTMKPLQKVVTAQDIQSSLYYLHVDDPADDDLRAATYISQDREEASDLASHTLLEQKSAEAVSRKPLPPASLLSRSDLPAPPPEPYPHFQTSPQNPQSRLQLGRKPVNTSSPRETALSAPSPAASSHGLLGPRPFHQRLHSADSTALAPAPGRGASSPRRWSEQPPALPVRPEFKRKEVRSEQRIRSSANKSDSSASGSGTTLEQSHWWSLGKSTGTGFQNDGAGNGLGHTQSPRMGISVTLIRRDPGSGGQWNIGNILTRGSSQDDGSREGSDSKPTTSSLHANSIINIEINVPGYLKFTVPNATDNSHPPSDNGIDQRSPPPKLLIQQDRIFRRQLWTGGPASDRHSEHSSPLRDGDASRKSRSLRPSFDTRRGRSAEGEDCKPRRSSQGRPPGIKDYTFRSPWNGLCEFTTGIAGRSLKCKHTLVSSSNPSAAASQPVTVSELRFNLPSSKIFPSTNSASEASAKTTSSKRSPVFSMNHSRTASAESVDGEEENGDGMDRLDLSLGQEYAGGGFGGKAAKLGKLIVEDEGLKMLDLLVAANMGVWWRVWERGGG
ncbi:hypothetical protein LPUS_10906 [Lasallia pustulata]|uniref:Uncharacterized protein n=1 Tax=Lasallia pustulata TaxID=136370 RepID=A0A1W5DAM3_9LECA|nr:hypothetical protein LPUS_10906 [Lasallia pustulata]